MGVFEIPGAQVGKECSLCRKKDTVETPRQAQARFEGKVPEQSPVEGMAWLSNEHLEATASAQELIPWAVGFKQG